MKEIPINHIFLDDTLTASKINAIINQLNNTPNNVPLPKRMVVMGNIESILKYMDTDHDIRRYVILTDDKKKFEKHFNSNSIIDTSLTDFVKIPKIVKWMLKDYTDAKRKIFVTSDHHFNHANIIKYCNRPWNSGKGIDGNVIVAQEDVDRMNSDMIQRWNDVVGQNDVVYHLGDFALGDKTLVPEIVAKLNGNIRLVLGNHDKKDVKFYYDCGFDRVYDKSIIVSDFFILSHEPMMFIGPNNCLVNIHGHVHNSDNFKTFTKSSCCVCVERWDYMPVEWGDIVDGLKRENGDA